MRITVVPNLRAAEAAALAGAVCDRLRAADAEVHIAREADGLPGSAAIAAALADSDIAVAIGGDGTIMHVAKAAAAVGCPVLGINGGHLGFLAGVERHELEALAELMEGNYTLEERMLLQVTVHTGTGDTECLAMNEAVFSRGSLSRLVDVHITAATKEVLTCRGDGVIVATPTGSTAYSMSAGGPVVDPAVDCVLLTPVCPHALDSRSRLLPADRELTVQTTAADDGEAFLTVDGEESIPLAPRDTVTIRRADAAARLIRLKSATFYDVLQEKLAGRR